MLYWDQLPLYTVIQRDNNIGKGTCQELEQQRYYKYALIVYLG